MSKRSQLRHPDKLYKCSPSIYCGFLVKNDVMRKLQKITTKFEMEVREILSNNIDNIEMDGWSLAHPNGKQVSVEFAEPRPMEEKIQRIKLFKARQPEYMAEVYRCRAFSDDAEIIIKEIEEEALLDE